MESTFSQKVYYLCTKIPKGKVSTYKIIAEKLNTKAYRSVGTILSKNKDDSIPCHRIINQNGFIGKFSKNGNIKTKYNLLKNEGIKINKMTLKVENFENYLYTF